MSRKGVLLLRLKAPLQSWGDAPRRAHFTTNKEPTKSGIVGLLCQALGRDFSEDVSDLARLVLTVRVDKEGQVIRDFHTVMGVPDADEPDPPRFTKKQKEARQELVARGIPINDVAVIEKQRGIVVTHRYYLQSAVFVAALEGDFGLLTKLEEALIGPKRTMWLGRKSCLPGEPIWVPGGLLVDATGLEALMKWPLDESSPAARVGGPPFVRLVIDLGLTSARGELRRDWPLSLDPRNRRFAPRRIEMRWVDASTWRAGGPHATLGPGGST